MVKHESRRETIIVWRFNNATCVYRGDSDMKLTRIEQEIVNEAASQPHDGTRDVSVHMAKNGRMYSVYFSTPGESVSGAICIAENLPQSVVKVMQFQHGRTPADKLTLMYDVLDKMERPGQ